MPPLSPWKLGVVSYLNALPLYWNLRQGGTGETRAEVPAQLASLLDAGECDAALLPVVDHFRGHGDGTLSDGIIGATGEVRSVLLFSRVPAEGIRSIAADTSSHTSVALLGVLLRDLYGKTVPFVDAAPHLPDMLGQADAALLIGDPALEAYQNPGELHVLDLATAWMDLTGLPFVFAAWTARRGLENRAELAHLLQEARDAGKESIAEIVAANPTGSALPGAVVSDYLTRTIEHTLTDAHRAGMEEFRRRLGY